MNEGTFNTHICQAKKSSTHLTDEETVPGRLSEFQVKDIKDLASKT